MEASIVKSAEQEEKDTTDKNDSKKTLEVQKTYLIHFYGQDNVSLEPVDSKTLKIESKEQTQIISNTFRKAFRKCRQATNILNNIEQETIRSRQRCYGREH